MGRRALVLPRLLLTVWRLLPELRLLSERRLLPEGCLLPVLSGLTVRLPSSGVLWVWLRGRREGI